MTGDEDVVRVHPGELGQPLAGRQHIVQLVGKEREVAWLAVLAAKERGDKAGWMHCYRQAVSWLGGNRSANALAKRLFEEIAPQFRDRNGGYTRVVRHWKGRLGDNAPQAIFELVGYTPAVPEEAPAEGVEGEPDETPAADAGKAQK